MAWSENTVKTLFEWIKQFIALIPVEVLVGLSLVSLLTVLLIPFYFKQLPQDYFIRFESQSSPILVRWLRNLVGGLFVFAGLLMLVLPGQGLLTLLIGLCLIESPARRHLIKKLTSSARFRLKINKLRITLGAPPFVWQLEEKRSLSPKNKP